MAKNQATPVPLPYDYVLKGLASDWWSLIKLEWLESGKFGLGGARDFGTGNDGTTGSGGGVTVPKPGGR